MNLWHAEHWATDFLKLNWYLPTFPPAASPRDSSWWSETREATHVTCWFVDVLILTNFFCVYTALKMLYLRKKEIFYIPRPCMKTKTKV